MQKEEKQHEDNTIVCRFGNGASLFDLVALADFLEGELKVRVDVISEGAVRSELREVVAV